ncbi:MAG: serine--tRNA ligase [Patescibacteria group bacterium]
MLDVDLLRKEPDKVKKAIAAKNADPKLVDNFLVLDEEWRKMTAELEGLRAEQNRLSETVAAPGGGARLDSPSRRGREPRPAAGRDAAKTNKVKIKDREVDLSAIEKKREELWLKIPNLPSEDTPVGKDEAGNKVLRKVGEPRVFSAKGGSASGGDFKPKDHLELGEGLGIIDFDAGAKVAGSGFYYLKNDGVLLELALVRYALDFLRENGFDLWLTPDLAREKFYIGTGYQPRGPEAQTYVIENSDLGLVATAEVTLAGIHAEEILDENTLPKLYAGYSHCFRQEAGAYGKYSRGLYRVHQFTKVEMFAYARPEDSPRIHEQLLTLEERLWQGLGIPYRVVEMCTGDLGAQAARKFDLEAWMPGREDWGEVTSTSNTTDYQARRLGTKLRRSNGKTEFIHTLNGTAIATSRGIIAIMENYQTADGKIAVPKALQQYMGKDMIG